MSNYIPLNELRIYQSAMLLGEQVWNIASQFQTPIVLDLMRQWTRATDSVALNIAEGYGRFHHKEVKNFCYYARGSLFESRACLNKAKNRNLITEDIYVEIDKNVENLLFSLNTFIKTLKEK